MKKLLTALCTLLVLSGCNTPKPIDFHRTETEKAKVQRMAWFNDARFGMFIHWGLYAIPAGVYNGTKIPRLGEWIMHRAPITIAEYEKFAPQFNPINFNAEEWIQMAKNAGMKYIVITTKHHDGFCLWDSKVTDWDIMDATPYKRDILKELADACKKHNISLCFYYSIMDWHHPDAQAMWEPVYNQGPDSKKINPNFARYVQEYMKPQLKELLTNYGDIGILWFDGHWVPDYTTEMGKDVYNYVRNLQPDLIVNNRVDKGREAGQGTTLEGDFAGDYGTPEQVIPDTGLPGVDWESCMTINDTWGYKSFDDNWKSNEKLIHNLIDIASKGGNFLLNVGPMADGIIPEPSVERLNTIGKWISINGDAIYGTSASPFEKPEWGRYSQKENKLYVHVFEWPENQTLGIPAMQKKIVHAYLMADESKTSLKVNQQDAGITIALPKAAPDDIASVIVIEQE